MDLESIFNEAVNEQPEPVSVTSTETEEKAETKPRPRPRVRLINAVELLARAGGVELAPGWQERIFDMTEDEFGALLQHLTDEVGSLLLNVARPAVPGIDVQLENFVRWQAGRGAYFQWAPEAMEALRTKLAELGDGIELIPCFAMSVQVKLRNGKLILLNRRGEETKG